MSSKTHSIGVVGLGKLGLPLLALLAKHFRVYGVDTSKQRVQQILNREKFFETQLNDYLDKYGHSLRVSTDYALLKSCETVFIITQTPSLPSGKFDLEHVESALKQVHHSNPQCLAVVGSTINIGDMGKLKTIHPRIAYNPEFIAQGSIINDFQNPKFVLVGAYSKEDGCQLADVWKAIHNKPIFIVKPVEAEIIKLSLNVSLTLGITFANMIGELCEKFNVDSNEVLEIIYRDRRNYKVGLGFGGPCFPRDVNCFRTICKENFLLSGDRLGKLLNELNDYTIERITQKIKSLGNKVGILGVGYKPSVPYIDESQPLKIAKKLVEQRCEVYVYDALAEENARCVLPTAHFCSSPTECEQQADVIFVGLPHYRNLKTSKPVVNPWK